MPPAHGMAVVDFILGRDDLAKMWRDELGGMTRRIKELRRNFASQMVEAANMPSLARIESEKGMFSVLPLIEGAASRLAREEAIYVPDNGRINIAGINAERSQSIALKLAPFLQK